MYSVLLVLHYDTCASESRPERVQLCVHTTEPTGPVPERFHCDHIARWSARSGTTGRSGTGVNTGARLRSGTVPVPKLWCEHGLIERRLTRNWRSSKRTRTIGTRLYGSHLYGMTLMWPAIFLLLVVVLLARPSQHLFIYRMAVSMEDI